MEKLRIGVIGIGNMGTGHVRNIREGQCPEIELTAACDIDANRLKWITEFTGGEVAVFSDALELMDSGLVAAVLIAVPHYGHPVYAKEAFKRGLHVMSEKPAGVYTKQVREMNEAAAASGLVFGLMFNQRTDPVYRKMKEIIESGELGTIRRTNWLITNWYRPQAYYDSGSWRATWSGEGGGVLLNQCPHNLDLWQWICGLPQTVRAFCHFGKWHDIEVEDDVTAYVEYPNGATGTFITTTADYPGSNRFEIDCEKGKLLYDGGKLSMWALDQSEPEYSRTHRQSFSHPEAAYSEPEIIGSGTGHVGVLNAFADAVLHGGSLIARGEEGIRSLELANAMLLSTWLGQEIKLPVDEDVYYAELEKRARQSRVKPQSAASGPADLAGTFGGAS